MQNTPTRRSVLKMGIGASFIPVIGAACSKLSVAGSLSTPQQAEGPFYPVRDQADKDVDLTLIEGKTERARGEVIHVRGRVLDTNGKVLDKAFVEIWQANTHGRYSHHRDPNRAPLDPNFQGWGQTYSDDKGYYGFKTILPGAYPAGPGWTRPPHIHFKAAKQNYQPLTTQMYFPQQQLNTADFILQRLSAPEQQMVIAKRQDDENGKPVFVFDIVLRQAG
jgi:protocatechuate 3,4-dioxygenase beta subunit